MNRIEAPFNISIAKLDQAAVANMRQVTSLDIYESSGGPLHSDGLFSLEIFGRVGEERRDHIFAYIDVRVPIFHPLIFRTLTKLKALYGGILTATEYARWDDEIKDFVSDSELTGRTGYQFFMERFKDIVFKENKSTLRSDRIKLIQKYKDVALSRYVLVLPAGLRDIETDEAGRVSFDEINSLYTKLMSISKGVVETFYNDVNDTLHLPPILLQRAFNEIYDTIENIITGKKGFIQKKFGSRKVYNGTRNVITAMDTSTPYIDGPNSPSYTDTVIGLFQCIKSVLPKTIHALRYSYLPNIFNAGTDRANLVNPKTLESEIVDLSPEEYDRWTTVEGLEKVINSYGEQRLRSRPVRVNGHYLALIYAGPDMTFKVFHDIRDLPSHLDRRYVRPITLVEFIYLSGYKIWNEGTAFVTRYPVTGTGSSYPSTVYTKTTTVGEMRKELDDSWEPMGDEHIAIEFPTFPAVYLDSQVIPTSRIARLGADFDGDMCSFTAHYSKEGVEEVKDHLNSRRAYVDPRGGLNASVDVDMVKLVLHNMTSTPRGLQ